MQPGLNQHFSVVCYCIQLYGATTNGINQSMNKLINFNMNEFITKIFLYCSEQILPALNLWEFYGVDVNKVVDDFKAAFVQKLNAVKNSQSTVSNSGVSPEVMIVQDPEYRRLGSTIDIKKAVRWYLSTR